MFQKNDLSWVSWHVWVLVTETVGWAPNSGGGNVSLSSVPAPTFAALLRRRCIEGGLHKVQDGVRSKRVKGAAPWGLGGPTCKPSWPPFFLTFSGCLHNMQGSVQNKTGAFCWCYWQLKEKRAVCPTKCEVLLSTGQLHRPQTMKLALVPLFIGGSLRGVEVQLSWEQLWITAKAWIRQLNSRQRSQILCSFCFVFATLWQVMIEPALDLPWVWE